MIKAIKLVAEAVKPFKSITDRQTDTQTERQTERQTDATENITTLHSQVTIRSVLMRSL